MGTGNLYVKVIENNMYKRGQTCFLLCVFVDSWGRISYARGLVEVCSNSELKKEVSMVIPLEGDNGHSTKIICVEYEWTPPH